MRGPESPNLPNRKTDPAPVPRIVGTRSSLEERTRDRLTERPRRILLLGPPGSGKGTQARRLGERLGLALCSTGGLLREEERRRSRLGREIHRYLREGRFVPDRLILEMVTGWLTRVGEDFILDGFPRTLAQGKALDAYLLARSDHPRVEAICLEVPEDLLAERVAQRVVCDACGHVWRRTAAPERCPDCGQSTTARTDDAAELHRSRLAEFRRKTLPLIPYYREGGRLRSICGQGSPDLVFRRILKALDS